MNKENNTIPDINDILNTSQKAFLEKSLQDAISNGWGSVRIIIERGQVTMLEKITTDRVDKLK